MGSLFARKKYEVPTYQTAMASTEFKPQQNSSLFASKTPGYSQGLFSSASRQPQNTINTNLMSIAPKQPQMSVSDNSKRFDLTPTPRVTTPPPPPRVDPMAQYTARLDDFVKRQGEVLNQRAAQEEANRQKEQDFTNQRYGLMNDQVKASIPTLRNTFNTFKGNTQAAVADTVAQGEAQKEQTRDYFGEANRTAAQARGETQAQARQKFASQGAVDSAGAGSYQQANENIDSDFNTYVQKNSKELAYKLTDIDSAVGQYQREASTLIQSEEAKLGESLRQIEYQLADNEIAKNQAIQQVYSQYQDRINGIQDTLSQIEQQAIEQKNNIGLELDKLSKTTFTPEFMATGVPTNQAEYEFMVTNADKMKELGIFGGGGGNPESESKLRSEYYTRTKENNYNQVVQQYQKIMGSEDSAAGDLGLIFAYMKLLDPTSTVREGEFANAQNATGIPSQVMNAYNRAVTGGRINPTQRADFKNSALAYVTPVINQQKEAERYFTTLAQQQGIDPSRIIGGYGSLGTSSNMSSSENDPLGIL